MLQGRDNFIRLRNMISDLCVGGAADAAEAQRLKTVVDDTEHFYQSGFKRHLSDGADGSCSCCCYKCGFDTAGTKCTAQHVAPCTGCAPLFEAIADLRARIAEQRAAAAVGVERASILLEMDHTLDCCLADLLAYRSHLARHVSEAAADEAELAGLQDHEAVVTCDYKMKVLSSYFRENQAKFFGKKGTSCLGFMIARNAADGSASKDVSFAMCFTGDGLQDSHGIMCAKQLVYSTLLPEGITHVIFKADGAGCFASELSRCAQPHWERWAGVVESVYRISPAGAGKSNLDGMFGRLKKMLDDAVDAGASYWDAPTILEAADKAGGLPATTFLEYTPVRGVKQLTATLPATCPKVASYTRTTLSSDGASLECTQYTGYDDPAVVDWRTALWAAKGSKLPPKALLEAELERRQLNQKGSHHDLVLRLGRDAGGAAAGAAEEVVAAVAFAQLAVCPPVPEYFVTRGENKRAAEVTVHKPKGQGDGNEAVRQEKRARTVKAAAARGASAASALVEEKVAAGLLCCTAVCPETLRVCEFTTRQAGRFADHTSGRSGLHSWHQRAGHGGSGVNASDVIVRMAAKPGGVLASGRNPDRLGTVEIAPSPVPVLTGGAAMACCAAKFLKPPYPTLYVKPPRLVQELRELYAVGQGASAGAKKLRATDMRESMAKMRSTDGSLFFCWAKRGMRIAPKDTVTLCDMCGKNVCCCNGALLTLGQIQASINSATQARKAVDG